MGYPTNYDAKYNEDPDRPGVYNQGYIFTPRPLFPKYFLPNVNHPLNVHLKTEDTYILAVGIQPVIDFYQNWKENKKSAYDESVRSSFEGHLRTDYKATIDEDKTLSVPFWKNYLLVLGETKKELPNWPQWIVDRLTYFLPTAFHYGDFILDLPRSIFANIFSRKLPRWGNMNDKILWKDLSKPTLTNILSLNAFAHHSMI